jgi:hypothetical protein
MRSDLEQAVALLQRAEGDALGKAVALLQQSVFAFGMRVCGQRQEAEDTMPRNRHRMQGLIISDNAV